MNSVTNPNLIPLIIVSHPSYNYDPESHTFLPVQEEIQSTFGRLGLIPIVCFVVIWSVQKPVVFLFLILISFTLITVVAFMQIYHLFTVPLTEISLSPIIETRDRQIEPILLEEEPETCLECSNILAEAQEGRQFECPHRLNLF